MFNNSKDLDSMIGKSYFFRTVTYHVVGKVVGVFNGHFLIIQGGSWVAESGRFGAAIETGTLDELEYVGECCVNLESVTDFYPWKHALPTETK